MFFARDAVFTTLYGSPPWNLSLRLKTIHETELDGFDTHSDNTVLIGVFLAVKHNSSARNARASTRPHGGASSAGRSFNQLKFYNGNIKYDRIFTFGELNTPGKCFVIITETVSESDFLLRHMRDSSTVGDLVAVIEPEGPQKALNDMPVVSTITPLVPFQTPQRLPHVPIITPQPREQRYFLLKGIPIRMSRATLVPASCKGVLCDRQQPPNRHVQCGCMFTSKETAVVIQSHVTFDYIDENGATQTHTVNNHRSWKTTKLFITPLTPTTDCTAFYAERTGLRASVTAAVQIANDNGGWNIIGWFRRGEVVDASANQEPGSEIANVNHPIHISSLLPTSADAVTQMEAMRFTPTTDDSTESRT